MHDNLLSGLEIKLSISFAAMLQFTRKSLFNQYKAYDSVFYRWNNLRLRKKMSFSWLVVKKVNKFCSTKEHCLTLISCFLQCWCLVSMSVFQPHFKLCRLFVYAMHSRIINHIVYTTKKCFSPDARDMVARSIVANPIVI